MNTPSDTSLILTGLAIFFLFGSLVNLVYPFFSASTLALVGIIILNYVWGWFDWWWLLWFIFLWLIAISCGVLMTAKGGKESLQAGAWVPVVGAIVGSIMIPIPFIGALVGVFISCVLVLYMQENELQDDHLQKALRVTFSTFLGLIMEIGAVITMFISTLLLAIF